MIINKKWFFVTHLFCSSVNVVCNDAFSVFSRTSSTFLVLATPTCTQTHKYAFLYIPLTPQSHTHTHVPTHSLIIHSLTCSRHHTHSHTLTPCITAYTHCTHTHTNTLSTHFTATLHTHTGTLTCSRSSLTSKRRVSTSLSIYSTHYYHWHRDKERVEVISEIKDYRQKLQAKNISQAFAWASPCSCDNSLTYTQYTYTLAHTLPHSTPSAHAHIHFTATLYTHPHLLTKFFNL